MRRQYKACQRGCSARLIVIDIGSQIDNALYRSRGNRNATGEWSKISYDLRILADTYGLRGYNNGNQNRNTDWRNRVPFPLPF